MPSRLGDKLDLLATIFEEADVVLAYAFGSFLDREASADIDLAVLPGNCLLYTSDAADDLYTV